MTCRELLAIEHKKKVDRACVGGCEGCPHDYDYAPNPYDCDGDVDWNKCTRCWDREADEEAVKRVMGPPIGNVNAASLDEIKQAVYAASGIPASVIENNKELDKLAQIHREHMTNEPKILDSGDRTEFDTGAVRDMRKGKGRCDLLPLDVVAEWIKKTARDPYPERTESTYWIFTNIYRFQETGNITFLYHVLNCFVINYDYTTTMLLEVAKQFEEGAEKYGDNNWRKGIPSNVYIDSAIRHYLKYLRGDKDEPHDRAFCWNILCCIWTVKHIENSKED